MNTLLNSHILKLRSLCCQSIDVIKIINDYTFYIDFRGVCKSIIKLPNVLIESIQCCVHGNDVFILKKSGYFGMQNRLCLFSISNQQVHTLMQTYYSITDFAICGKYLVVTINPYPNRNFNPYMHAELSKFHVNYFTLDGKFEYGFNVDNVDNSWTFISICDKNNVIYVFSTCNTQIYSFTGKLIHIMRNDFTSFITHKIDRHGNAYFRFNPYYINWIHEIGFKIEKNTIIHSDYDSIHSGHLSKFGSLFLNDSKKIHIFTKVPKNENSAAISMSTSSLFNPLAICQKNTSLVISHTPIKCCALDSIGRLFVFTDTFLYIYQ